MEVCSEPVGVRHVEVHNILQPVNDYIALALHNGVIDLFLAFKISINGSPAFLKRRP